MKYIDNGPAIYKGYVFVPTHRKRRKPTSNGYIVFFGALTILRLSDGSKVRTIKFSEAAWDAQVCGHYLALGTACCVYLYDITDPTNPEMFWNYNGIARKCGRGWCSGAYNVTFSPDCRYLVSTNVEKHKIHLFDIVTRRQVLKREFEDGVWSVAWWKDRIAVGLSNGNVYVF